MKEHEQPGLPGADVNSSAVKQHADKPHHGWRLFGIVCVVLLLALGMGRLMLPHFARNYVNRTLDRNLRYEGRIGEVEIHLWRGAYSIYDVHISQRNSIVPVPLFAAKRVEFSIQWDALIHGRVVGRFLMEEPELNFVAGSAESEAQTGADGPWLEMIRDLFPFTINSAVIHNGSAHFRTYQSAKPVDVYLSHLEGSVDDLSNIRDQSKPLVTTVQATAMAMDQARLDYKMTLDPFSYRPTFHLAVRLLGLDVTNLNDLALTYGKFDFKRGWFDLVLEADSKEGQITGYVKPLFRDVKIFSLPRDLKEDNPLQFFWQALVGGVAATFKNFPRHQFGTLIPFSGSTSGTTRTDILATIGNLLRNAFVRAYLPRMEAGLSRSEDLQFEAPSLIESLSTTPSTAQ